MAEIHKKGDGTETTNGDIPVVAPINMGKGHKWNPETGQYDVSIAPEKRGIGSGLYLNENGEMGVALSKEPTNLLQMKPDGVYYGIQPPANVAELYVDAENGVDADPNVVDGAGTRANPLRTFRYANELAVLGTKRTILLRCNQEHILSPSMYFDIKAGQLIVEPYGDEFETALQRGNGDYPVAFGILRDEKTGPILKFAGNNITAGPPTTREYTYQAMSCFGISNGASVYFSGIILRNDISAKFNKSPQATTEEMRYGTISRMSNRTGSVMKFDRCYFESVGDYSLYEFSNVPSHKLMTEKNGKQIFQGGFIDPAGGSIQALFCKIDENIKCHFVSHHGWGEEINANFSLGLTQTGQQAMFAKLVFGAKIDNQNGVKILLAPKADVSATLFE